MFESHPFDPIINQNSQLLILGTFPSLDSFKYQFYYAHKRNQFWKILGEIFEDSSKSDEEKIQMLLHHHIALWDIVKSCERKNSADSNLKNCIPHDIPTLLHDYPAIKKILFTGKKAQQIYLSYFKDLEIQTFVLPSPSPAYASMRYEEKLACYREQILV